MMPSGLRRQQHGDGSKFVSVVNTVQNIAIASAGLVDSDAFATF